MKTTYWKLFRYLVIDHKAAQDWLNEMAAEGWELEHIYLGLFARFRRTERRDLTYFLDWTSALEDAEYLQLCSDAGWDFVQSVGYLNFYAAKPGARPLPIQTDPELEYQRFQKKTARNVLFSAAYLAVLLAVCVWIMLTRTTPSQLLADLLTSYSTLVFLGLTALPVSLFLTLYLLLVLRWGLACRRALRQGEPLPTAGQAQARKRGLLRVTGRGYLLLCALFFLADVLINQVFSLSFALTMLVLQVIIFLGSRKDDPSRHRQAKAHILSFILPVLICSLLSFPLRAILPHRAPPFPLPHWEEDGRQRDSLIGSRLRWSWYSDPADEDHFRWTANLYIWASPALMERFSPYSTDGLEPVEGRPGLWRIADDRYLFCQGTSQMELTSITREDFSDELLYLVTGIQRGE